MTPDSAAVRELDASLSSKNMGVVAHYYMDAELQVWPMTRVRLRCLLLFLVVVSCCWLSLAVVGCCGLRVVAGGGGTVICFGCCLVV